MNFRPQNNHRQQGYQHQQRADQAQGLGTDGVEVDFADFRFDRAFGAGGVGGIFFAAGALGEDFRTAVFGAIEGQTPTLNQHPTANNMVNHQQQEPDGDRGFQSRQ